MLFPRESSYLLFRLSPMERSWRGVVYLLAVYLGALLIAAVLSPWVYWGIQHWHATAPNAFTAEVEDNAFPDYFDRLRWLPTLIALPFVLKACGLLSWSALGVRWRDGGGRAFLRWFAAGFVILVGVAGLQAAHYGAGFRVDAFKALEVLLLAMLSGVLVGLLEEIVFRGMVFRMVYTATGPVVALVATSLFFSYAHFKIPDAMWVEGEHMVHAGSGFYVAGWTLAGIFAAFDPLVFLNLALFGVVLGLLVFLGRGSLMPAIGFHAGIVAAILTYTDVTNIQALTREAGVDPFWGSGGLRDGLLTTLAFVLTAGLLAFLLRKRGGCLPFP